MLVSRGCLGYKGGVKDPPMRVPLRLFLSLLAAQLGACALPLGAAPGAETSAVRPYLIFDLGESMQADSLLEIADLGPAGSFAFESTIDGRWGLSAGVEFDLFTGGYGRVGWAARRLRPLDIQGLAFGSMTQLEAMTSLLWEPLGRDEPIWGWVPHFELRLGLVPRTLIPTVFGPGTADIPLLVDASSYWKWGLGAGISRPLGQGLRIEFGAIYEEAISPAEADSFLVVSPVFQVPTHTEFSPRGWLFSGGLIWSL